MASAHNVLSPASYYENNAIYLKTYRDISGSAPAIPVKSHGGLGWLLFPLLLWGAPAVAENAAHGLAATGEWAFTDRLTARVIASLRHSEYKAGLDDDGFFDDFLSFPEEGEADQASVEAQFLGDFGSLDFVAGIYHFTEDGSNVQDPTVFLGFPGAFLLTQKLNSTAVFASLGGQISERWRVAGGLRTTEFEWESSLYVATGFRLHLTLGYLKVDVDRQQNVRPVAPLTPKLTLSVSPEYRWPLTNGAELTARLDYSYRDSMWGEPSSDPGRLTRIGSRSLINFHLGYTAPNDNWTAAIYGRNIGDVRYDNARLNTGDYLLRILSNDASEFGVRVEKRL